ncbi:dGTPase [Affinibrenneria salicis]|uniref:Deoxyguanosinetriphosphate triphosphohydrolase n=1 Tax=Affinibrenneria salicis TaxID=2590031 RepID=A0A5J5FRQ4_9GAMM|nr:dGTPase [Affinibrenneria salicis]KAA8995504.1 dGTPase [Affinibrenneria salicis]
MADIDFKQKISFQRPFNNRMNEPEDEYAIVRQFESDRGRIINSAAIRRLQQKTQVFPLERNAAVRSRLTHSLEVQQVGRYIAKYVLEDLKRDNRLEAYGLAQLQIPFESMVEMACLMHDIGNPPFGHFGESAINNWFRKRIGLADGHEEAIDADNCALPFLRLRAGETERNALRCRIRQDLCHFEGNAQAIRLVHTLLKLNLTYAQVGCILKYTRPAYWRGAIPDAYHYLMKKPGYYLAEEAFVTQLRGELGMQEHHRYPLTYIMEAADDISYCIADLEDAVEKDIFTVAQLHDYLLRSWGEPQPGDLFTKTVGKAFDLMTRSRWRSSDDQFFMNLRVFTVNKLVPHAAQRFLHSLPAIFDGSFNQALLEDESAENKLLKTFKRVALQQVFNHHEVEQLELQGYRVIGGLLDIYSPLLALSSADFHQLVERDYHPDYPIETRLYHKLSSKHRLAYCEAVDKLTALTPDEREIYEYYYRARLIQDYISGMTDLYAYDEYRRLMAAD